MALHDQESKRWCLFTNCFNAYTHQAHCPNDEFTRDLNFKNFGYRGNWKHNQTFEFAGVHSRTRKHLWIEFVYFNILTFFWYDFLHLAVAIFLASLAIHTKKVNQKTLHKMNDYRRLRTSFELARLWPTKVRIAFEAAVQTPTSSCGSNGRYCICPCYFAPVFFSFIFSILHKYRQLVYANFLNSIQLNQKSANFRIGQIVLCLVESVNDFNFTHFLDQLFILSTKTTCGLIYFVYLIVID